MSLEQDIIRIRQKLTYLEQHGGGGGEGTDGKSLWVTYHTADHIGSPPNPTGDGSTGGWSTTASENSGWMSTKLAYTITEGQWSDPIRIRGYDGSPGTFYYIKPVNGTAIKNHTGTLTIEARKLEGGTDSLLGNGSIQLYYLDSVPETPVWKLVHTSNGFQAGSNGFTGVLNSDNISGSIVIVLKDGVDGTPLDTITLVDVADGLPGPEGEPGSDGEPGTPGSPGAPGQDGINAIVGSVTSDRGLVFARAKNSGVWTPAETTTKLTVTYYQGGGVLAARDLVITRTDGTLSAPTPSSVDGITYTRIGNDTAALTIEFQHVASGIKAAETVYVTQGGDKGDTGDQGPKGDDGEDGEDGKTYGAVSDDVPELTGVRFVINGVNIAWNGGKVEYKGVEYTLASNTTGFNNDYVYLDMADTIADGTNAILKGDEDLDVATDISGSNHWLVCKRDGGKAYPASPFKIVTATAIQAGSLSAVSANLGDITSGSLVLTTSNELTRWRIDSTGIAGSWRANTGAAWGDWKYVAKIDANGRTVASFDSYDSGDAVGLVQSAVVSDVEVVETQYYSSSFPVDKTAAKRIWKSAQQRVKVAVTDLSLSDGSEGKFYVGTLRMVVKLYASDQTTLLSTVNGPTSSPMTFSGANWESNESTLAVLFPAYSAGVYYYEVVFDMAVTAYGGTASGGPSGTVEFYANQVVNQSILKA